MFYQDDADQALRFGDVVKGYVLTNTILNEPIWHSHYNNYSVDVNIPQFAVIMTPCCSIKGKKITLTPLIAIYPTFFDTPYLGDDLTRVNRMMTPEQSIPPHVWQDLGDEERQRRLAEGRTFAFRNLFVYEKHELLPEYTLHRRNGRDISTKYHMIDFSNLYKVHCDRIASPTDSPLECRSLQLSRDTRDQLRVKVARYYVRTPKEDQVIEP